jgi:hypothetical protein
MTYAAAITQLLALTVTGVNNSYSARNEPVMPNELPALIIDDTSQPFTEGLHGWDLGATAGNFIVFLDHILLIESYANSDIETRYANRNLYLDRYLNAIIDDMLLNNNLIVPLKLVVTKRGMVSMRKRNYSGIVFRHQWQLRIT